MVKKSATLLLGPDNSFPLFTLRICYEESDIESFLNISIASSLINDK